MHNNRCYSLHIITIIRPLLAAAAIAHHTRQESQHRESPSNDQVLRRERWELQVGGGEPPLPGGDVGLAYFDALDAHCEALPNQGFVWEAEADDCRSSLLILDLDRRTGARDVQELEVVE